MTIPSSEVVASLSDYRRGLIEKERRFQWWVSVFRGTVLVVFGIPAVTSAVIVVGYLIGAIARVIGGGP